MKRVAVYIDHSNVFHRIKEVQRYDTQWIHWYDPLHLAQKLSGSRQLVFTNFYCTRPPASLMNTTIGKTQYDHQNNYYDSVVKLPDVNVFYGSLNGKQGSFQEKNLDTQLTAHLIMEGVKNNYDDVIIVSNDGDYKSAIESLKQINKKVEIAYFKGNCSMATRAIADITRRLRRSYFIDLDFPNRP